MNELMAKLNQYFEARNNEKGATMVEYALMVALIAVVCIAAVGLIGTNARTAFNSIAGAIGTAV